MRKNVTSTEAETAETERLRGQKSREELKGTHASAEIDAEFQKAVENGEIDGDVVLVDEQGQEILSAEPRRTIFDL